MKFKTVCWLTLTVAAVMAVAALVPVLAVAALETVRGVILVVSFSDDEFVIGPCRSTATHDNDRK